MDGGYRPSAASTKCAAKIICRGFFYQTSYLAINSTSLDCAASGQLSFTVVFSKSVL